MNSSSSAEPFVAPMMSFVGLESSSQKQLWDWEAAATATSTTADQNTNTTATFYHHQQHPSSLTNANPFFDCAATITPLLPMSNNPFYPASASAGMLIKSEDDAGARRIGLNLGHRTYFPSGDAAIDRLFRRSRGVYPVATQQAAPRCQAEGCKADLSGAKHYHRRHKVCEFHSKATVVLVAGGFQQRFCQQCSRFHVLSEFDEAKRSCRKRLADHNRRRRKPQPSSSTTPTTTTTTKVPSAPQHPNTTTSTEKSQQATQKSTTSVEATKGTITTSVMSSTVHNSNQANLSMEIPKDYLKEATLLRNGPTLSLGGAGGFGFQASYQQQHISSSSPSSSTFFLLPHNFLCSNSNEPPQPEQAYHHHHQSDDLLHHSQNVFEMDFI